VLGVILLEDHEREYAFGEAEIRLLTTIGASMGLPWKTRACSTRRSGC